jgi:hypothetical protein
MYASANGFTKFHGAGRRFRPCRPDAAFSLALLAVRDNSKPIPGKKRVFLVPVAPRKTDLLLTGAIA